MKTFRRHAWSLILGSVQLFNLSFAHAESRMPTHVGCVGDSITAGAGASSPAKNYPSVLQTLFGNKVQVKNFGHSGATMLSAGFGDLPYEDQTEYQSATSFVSGAGANAVVDVIIMLGTNDSKPFNWTPSGKPKNDQQYLKDYRAMVDHFTALNPKPLVFLALPLATGNSPCCAINGAVIHDEVIPLIKQLAVEKQLPIIDLNTPTTGHNEYFVDGVHPNDAAYTIVANLMHDGLLAYSGNAGSGGSAGSSGVAGAGGSAGSSGGADAGGSAGSSGGAGAGGSAGSFGGGATGGVGGGSGSPAGPGSGGAPQFAGASGHIAEVAGSAPATASNDESSGCAVSRHSGSGSSSGSLVLAFAMLAAGRRRSRS